MKAQYTIAKTNTIDRDEPMVLLTSGGGNKLHLGYFGSRSTMCYNGGGIGRSRDRGPILFQSREQAEQYLTGLTLDAICAKCRRHYLADISGLSVIEVGDDGPRKMQDADQTSWLEVARVRVRRNPRLAPHEATIMYDWPEGEAHWMWVATGSVDEIVDWAQVIEAGEDEESWAPALVSTGEAARRLGVDRRTVTGWCIAGRVPGAERTAGGHWRIPEDVLDRLRH